VSIDGSEDARKELYEELLRDASGPAPRSGLMRTKEVALLFHVSERAVTDWAARGRLPSIRTPGGHRRYPAEAVLELARELGIPMPR
jgi:excisionase family DNA binding protein